MTLGDLKRKQKAIITQLPKDKTIAAQLLEQGFVPNVEVLLMHKGLWSGPLAIKLNDTKMALGMKIAKQIQVEQIV
jgi:Fe2+ transport system protein FeoA